MISETTKVGAVGVALAMLLTGACVSSSARMASPSIRDALRSGYEHSRGGEEGMPYSAVLDGAG